LDEKKARQEAKMVAVGQLSAGLAHEIRNPLGLIKSYSYILENHKLNDICKHAVSVINDSVNRINNLIENLLRFSKLSNDEIKLVDIEKFLNSIVELEKKNLKDRDINIVVNIEGQSSKDVLINEEVLRMVLLNLINNSVDSLQEINKKDKNINLSIKMAEDNLIIRISDNGSGIDKSRIESIFDPFYSTKEKGTGLGLYILSTEITNNNGKISVESSKGQGTTFIVELPIKRR
jgi:signal transduction histidine kinase